MLRSRLAALRDTLLRWWRTPKIRRRFLLTVLGVTVFGTALVFGAWARACSGNRCPSIEGLESYDPDQASKVFAADGRLITDLGMERRTVLGLQEISPALVAAFLATEVAATAAALPGFAPLPLERTLGADLARGAGATGNELRLWPHRHGTDGFFVAAFERRKD